MAAVDGQRSGFGGLYISRRKAKWHSGKGDQEWLTELDIDQRTNAELGSDGLFVQVTSRNGEFRLESLLKQHPTGSAGRTALTPVTDHDLL